MKKAIFTLNIADTDSGFPDGYDQRITDITYPYIQEWANRIGASFHVIRRRRFQAWPILTERLQLYDLSRDYDWTIHIDSDALVHPETPDFTEFLPKDTVAHVANDVAAVRWDYDRHFRRDGRHIGACHWFGIASDWCREFWEPPSDISLAECRRRIHPTITEIEAGVTKDHLIDDFLISRNIAKYGLKFTTIRELQAKHGLGNANFFFHEYLYGTEEKIRRLKIVEEAWRVGENHKSHVPSFT